MTVLKSAHTIALDDVTQVAEEVIERIDTLIALKLDNSKLESTMKRHSKQLSTAVGSLCQQRRASGDLPAAGNIERAELAAVAQKVRSLFSAQPETTAVAKDMSSAYQELADRIGVARDTLQDGDALLSALEEQAQLVASIDREMKHFA